MGFFLGTSYGRAIRWFFLLIVVSLVFCMSSRGYPSWYHWRHADVIGRYQTHQVQLGEDLYHIARRYDVGFDELRAANKQVNPTHMVVGTLLVIPSTYILPRAKRKGIVINVSAMRLFYFDKKKKRIYTYPVGVGRPGWHSPTGLMTVIQKRYKPTWFIPQSVRRDYKKDGTHLPRYIRRGKNNPLGKYALRLSRPSYLIHGTNRQAGVGRRTTAGCFSMYDLDIKQLYFKIKKGTRVNIVKQKQLVGVDQHGRVWLENQDFSKLLPEDKKHHGSRGKVKKNRSINRYGSKLLRQVYRKNGRIDQWPVLAEALADEYSVPVIIGTVDHRH
jgi:L,D-transpeptidase ErfK/SrfK